MLSRRKLVSIVVMAAALSACGGDTVPTQPTAFPGELSVSSFTVGGSSVDGGFLYWPQLTLAETTGRGTVTVVLFQFELLDVLAGNVGPYRPPWLQIRAGQTIVLDEDVYGGPWFEIGSKEDASRVSVLITFQDGAGRAGSVRAVADVSR